MTNGRFPVAWRATGVVIALALVEGFASRARADDARDRAARGYEDARKAFEGGAYQAAAVAFERVFREVPNSASMLAAGRAWEKAGEPALAADDFATALAAGDLDPEQTAKTRERLDLLEAELGRVQVLGPDGTTASLGHAEAVRTPANVHARRGTARIIVTLPGGSQSARTVDVAPGRLATADFRPAAPVEAPERPRPTEPATGSGGKADPLRTAAWISGGGAVAAGIAAAILAPVFNTKNNAWNASPKTDAGQREDVVSFQVATDAAFLGALGLAAASAALFVVSSPTRATSATSSPGPSVSLGPGWVALSGHFQ